MKMIAANILNSEYFARIEDFCKQEKLEIIKIDDCKELSYESVVFFITDIRDNIDKINCNGIPVCLISNDKPNCYWFSLKPHFNVTNLRMLLDVIYYGYSIGIYPASVMHSVFHKEYIIDNDYFNIDRIVYAMTAELTMFFTFSNTQKIRVGISEMITNAIEHGNLEITAQEKMESTESGTYYELLEKRINDKRIGKRKTYVIINYKNEQLTVKIKDQGKGFDTNNIPDPTDAEQLLKLHGRGIFITKIYFSQIIFNKKGNEVTLIKKLSDPD